MELELTLKEKFLLLCYDPNKGRVLHSTTFSAYGVVGAIMLELAELGKIKVDNKKLRLVDAKTTGDEALDLVIERIAKSKRQKKISTWVSRIAQGGLYRKIKAAVRQSLISKRILSKRENTALLIFKYSRYPARNTRPRRLLIADIQNVVLKRQIGAKEIMMLTALVGATKMSDSFFIHEDRRKARKRIKEIMKSNEITKVLDNTITGVQTAIITAITTTAIISAAGRSSG